MKTKQTSKKRGGSCIFSLKEELRQIMTDMDCARNHFDQAVDPVLIDCYIYEINAAQLRYQFLLRRIKKSGIMRLFRPLQAEQAVPIAGGMP